ncbi:MAG: lipocalin-like domain-containing protein [Candidatus Cryptobacteroides sp.]|nr:DUF4923 family protein [Bacteroidales bacterium]
MKKRLFMSLAAAFVSAIVFNVSAQSLTDLLKGTKAGDVVNAVTNVVDAVTNSSNVSLPGTWKYTGPAIDMTGENALSNIAGSAVTSGMEKKVASAFEKVGIKEGTVSFTFNDGMSFSCTILGKTLNGTWKQNTDEGKLTLQFGQTMKYLSITGYLKATTSGCELLFESDRFLSFLKTVLSVVGNKSTTVSAISSLSNSYNGMKLGFKLSRQ